MFEKLSMFSCIDKHIYKDNIFEESDLYIEDNKIIKSFNEEINEMFINFKIINLGNNDYTIQKISNDKTSNRILDYILENMGNRLIAIKCSEYDFTFILVRKYDNLRRLQIAGILNSGCYIKFIEIA